MATKLPSGKYRAQVFVGYDIDHKRQYKAFLADTNDEADYLALQFKVVQGKQGATVRDMTVGQAIDKYIELNDGVFSATTVDGYKKIKRCYLQPIMDIKIKNITSDIFQASINIESKLHAPKTVRLAHSLVCTVLKRYRPDYKPDIRLPQREVIKYNTPDGKRLLDIFRAVKDTPIEIPVYLASWMSLSMGEVCGLKWSNVYANHISITENKVYADKRSISKLPKNISRNRDIVLPEFIKDKIIALPRSTEYVVNLTGQAIYKRFVKTLETNNLPKCTFHELRHASASIMLMLNIPNKYAQNRGGWSTDSTLIRVYQQTFAEEDIKAANIIDSYFLNLLQHDLQHE